MINKINELILAEIILFLNKIEDILDLLRFPELFRLTRIEMLEKWIRKTGVVIQEWGSQKQTLEKSNSKSKNIWFFFIQNLSLRNICLDKRQDLWRKHSLASVNPFKSLGLRDLAWLGISETEISQLSLLLSLIEENIFQLDIVVGKSLLVNMAHSCKDLSEIVSDLIRAQYFRIDLRHFVEQVSFTQLQEESAKLSTLQGNKLLVLTAARFNNIFLSHLG